MKTAASPSSITADPQKKTSQSTNRLLTLLPILVCLAALLLRIYVASREIMDFDEWQQVFMSAAPRWNDFTFELNAEAHPPLFFLLLRWLLPLGHSKLLYRCISIASGTGSVFLIWWIGRKVFRSAAVAALAAGVLALSAAAITISIEVRQYQLLVFLLLLAFSFYLDIVRDDAPGQDSYLRDVFCCLRGGCNLPLLRYRVPGGMLPRFDHSYPAHGLAEGAECRALSAGSARRICLVLFHSCSIQTSRRLPV